MVRQGLTIPFAGVSLPDHEPLLRRADALGYHDLWSGEATGYDGFTPLALAAAWTDRARLGTGVVNPYTRGPALLAQSAAALADASAGRFVLGIGSSSDRIVERWNGIPFEKPLTRVREAVAGLRPVFAGERGAGGFKLEVPPPEPIPIYVAALRGRMLRLAGEVGDGAWVNFLPLSAAEQVVGEVRAGEQAAGREPGRWTSCAASSTCRRPPRRGCRSCASCSRPTRPCRSTPSTSAGSASPTRSTPWWRPGRAATASARSSSCPRTSRATCSCSAGPTSSASGLPPSPPRGITTLCLTPIAPPEAVAGWIEAMAPG